MIAPLAPALDRDTLIRLISAESERINLDGAIYHSGWQNAVIETPDGWIFRFPRHESHDFARELAVLETVHGRLSAESPRVMWTGSRSRFAAYRTLTGEELDLGRYAASPSYVRDGIAESLARFLHTMHRSLREDEIAGLAIPGLGSAHLIAEVEKRREHIPASARTAVDDLMQGFSERWVGRGIRPSDVVLHNDFHLGNMAFDEPLGRLKAVWDFSCVELGEPSYDLRYFIEASPELAGRIAERYERLSGVGLDVDAATLAGRFESVSDAVVEGRDVEQVLHRWTQLLSPLRRG
jgi:aminoglycoside phosphotransferase (APT) family kinase protein